jgi:hypothetical protein
VVATRMVQYCSCSPESLPAYGRRILPGEQQVCRIANRPCEILARREVINPPLFFASKICAEASDGFRTRTTPKSIPQQSCAVRARNFPACTHFSRQMPVEHSRRQCRTCCLDQSLQSQTCVDVSRRSAGTTLPARLKEESLFLRLIGRRDLLGHVPNVKKRLISRSRDIASLLSSCTVQR